MALTSLTLTEHLSGKPIIWEVLKPLARIISLSRLQLMVKIVLTFQERSLGPTSEMEQVAHIPGLQVMMLVLGY